MPFKGITSLDKIDAPGWKHPRTGWLTGLSAGVLMNGIDRIPPLTFAFLDLDSLVLVED